MSDRVVNTAWMGQYYMETYKRPSFIDWLGMEHGSNTAMTMPKGYSL